MTCVGLSVLFRALAGAKLDCGGPTVDADEEDAAEEAEADAVLAGACGL